MQVLPARDSIAMHVCERSRRALEAGPARTILEAFAIYAQPVDIQAGIVRLLEIGARARLTVAVSTKSTCRHGVPLPAIIEDLGGHTDTARFPGGLPVGHHARETEHAGRGSRIREGNDALRAEAVRRSEVVDDERQYDTACTTRNSFWPRILLLTSITVTRSSGARFSPPTKAAAAGSGALACRAPRICPWTRHGFEPPRRPPSPGLAPHRRSPPPPVRRRRTSQGRRPCGRQEHNHEPLIGGYPKKT